MVDIQFPTAENRRGKKERRRKKVTTAAKYNGLPITVGGHNNLTYNVQSVEEMSLTRQIVFLL